MTGSAAIRGRKCVYELENMEQPTTASYLSTNQTLMLSKGDNDETRQSKMAVVTQRRKKDAARGRARKACLSGLGVSSRPLNESWGLA